MPRKKLLPKNTTFNQYAINQNYEMNKSYLKTIVTLLQQSQSELKDAVAFHIVLFWDGKHQSNQIEPTLAKLFKSKPYRYLWVNEKSEGIDPNTGLVKDNHTHLMVIFSTARNNNRPNKIVEIRDALRGLDGLKLYKEENKDTKAVFTQERQPKNPFISRIENSLHRLDTELDDAVKRYSYFAKTKTKLSGRSNIGYSKLPKSKQEWWERLTFKWPDGYTTALDCPKY